MVNEINNKVVVMKCVGVAKKRTLFKGERGRGGVIARPHAYCIVVIYCLQFDALRAEQVY